MTTDEKLDMLLSKMTTVESKMTTVESKMTTMESKMTTMESKMTTMESTMATKQDIADMVTNKSLDKRLNDIENNILEELDTVQEKSNKHYNDIDDQLKMANSVINTIKLENGTVNLLLKSVSDLQTEVESLKARLDKVS